MAFRRSPSSPPSRQDDDDGGGGARRGRLRTFVERGSEGLWGPWPPLTTSPQQQGMGEGPGPAAPCHSAGPERRA